MSHYLRATSNYALQRAADWARWLRLPLVVLSIAQLDYRWATERSHAFLLDSMGDVERALRASPVEMLTFIERRVGEAEGLVEAVARAAAVVVLDDHPGIQGSPEHLPIRSEAIDHVSIVPLGSTDRVFTRAYDLRRYLQRVLPDYLDEVVETHLGGLIPAQGVLADEIRERWPSAAISRSLLDDLPLDGNVSPTLNRGGQVEAKRLLDHFVNAGLARYAEKSHPDYPVASGLSAHLRFGNISVHDVFTAIAHAEGWDPSHISDRASGARAGWWGMGPGAEAFLDQIVTWRELGYRAARYVSGNDSYSALPEWARSTLEGHVVDSRPYLYSYEQLEAGDTHDDLWNAAQAELRDEGTIHSYLRMLWGKKILEWTPHPEDAHEIMFDLNNRYALDGRDPNSVSGIHWVLGRYDRPWGPERAIFGKVRYMSSESTRRKLRLKHYQSKMLNT